MLCHSQAVRCSKLIRRCICIRLGWAEEGEGKGEGWRETYEIACKGEVGLEAHLAGVGAAADGEGRGNLAGVVVGSREAGALEENLEEDLGVESEWGLEKA